MSHAIRGIILLPIAGTDCGFATFAAQQNPVVPSIVWAKLAALAEGAKIASDRLWGRA